MLAINSARRGKFQPTNQIVDFYVDSSRRTTGKFRVNFEDVEQGADHDMDAIAIYEYTVTGSNVDDHAEVRVRGRRHHSAHGLRHLRHHDRRHLSRSARLRYRPGADDPDYFLDTPPTYSGVSAPGAATAAGWDDNVDCRSAHAHVHRRQLARARILLKDPLWYAAKWGGFKDCERQRPARSRRRMGRGQRRRSRQLLPGDQRPRLSARSSRRRSTNITQRVGSASSASVNAGSISSETRVYQAKFNSGDWTGQLLSFPVQPR